MNTAAQRREGLDAGHPVARARLALCALFADHVRLCGVSDSNEALQAHARTLETAALAVVDLLAAVQAPAVVCEPSAQRWPADAAVDVWRGLLVG